MDAIFSVRASFNMSVSCWKKKKESGFALTWLLICWTGRRCPLSGGNFEVCNVQGIMKTSGFENCGRMNA